MLDDMETSKFNEAGKYRTAAGTDDLQAVDGVTLSLPADFDGLADYQEGDEMDFTIKGRKGPTDEEGNVTIEPINVLLKDMPAAAKMHRRDQRNGMPPADVMPPDDEGAA